MYCFALRSNACCTLHSLMTMEVQHEFHAGSCYRCCQASACPKCPFPSSHLISALLCCAVLLCALLYYSMQHGNRSSACAELRKDFVKRAPLPVGEVAAPIRSLAPPPTNMAQANNARGEGKVSSIVPTLISNCHSHDGDQTSNT